MASITSKHLSPIKDKVRQFPDKTGVYIMFDDKGTEIYIGKANSLKKRVASYFQSKRSKDNKTLVLLEKVKDVDYIVTDSEVEALLLESRMIREFKPRFNLELRDGEHYPFLQVIEEDDFPFAVISRETRTTEKRKRKFRYISKFVAVSELRAALNVLQRIFRFRTCSLVIRENDKRRKFFRPCLLFHIKRCSGPCAAKISKKEYVRDIDKFIQFLEGKKDTVITAVKAGMKKASEDKRYEDAARLRDELIVLKKIPEIGAKLAGDLIDIPFVNPNEALQELKKHLKLNSLPVRIEGIDISHISGSQSVGSLVTFLDGMPFREGYRRYKIKSNKSIDDCGMIEEVVSRRIKRQVKEEKDLPDILLIDGGKGQVNSAFKVLKAFKCEKAVTAVGIAKKKEVLYPAGWKRPLRLSEHSSALKLLCYVRDESHRFAQLYHKLLRHKKFRNSSIR